MSNLKLLKEKIRLLEDMLDNIDGRIERSFVDIIEDGYEDEQAVNWKGELKWKDEEHTIPYYRTKYKEVTIEEKDMDEDKLATLNALRDFREYLTKYIK